MDLLEELVLGCPNLTDFFCEVDANVMDYVTRVCPKFRPRTLVLNACLEPSQYNEEAVAELREQFTRGCSFEMDDEVVIYETLKNWRGNFENPFLHNTLERVGPGLEDLAMVGMDTVTQRCLELLPKLSALRLYLHGTHMVEIIPKRAWCESLVTLALVSTDVHPKSVIDSLLENGHTCLRALAMYNLNLHFLRKREVRMLGMKFVSSKKVS